MYIDPRNFEEFYFGKGKGSRKNAHLSDDSDSEKARRIAAIQKEGLEPIIRVIARDLSEHDALLVEKTLLWKLGKHLTNISSGHYSDKFRPHNSLHVLLSGFDYQSGIYYYNVGEGMHRNWDDYMQFGFISGGQGTRWRDAMLSFNKGDVIAAYLKGHGFVGVGQVISKAKPIREAIVKGKSLLSHNLVCKNMADNEKSDDLCEYVCEIDWIKTVDRSNAKWKPNAGIYTTPLLRASLDAQPDTLQFLEESFEINIRSCVI